MRNKFVKCILSIFLLVFAFSSISLAQDTLSDEILAQAEAEANLFLTLKQALGLDWLDEYNAYLADQTNPLPAWDTSVSALISQGYLPSSFPTDFAITPSGQEVTISRAVPTQSVREAMPTYLPTMTVSGTTVSLLVQRPAQWVATEAALDAKVSRDGSDNPDILPNASLDFGAGSQISFISNDGKVLGVNSLTYKGQEIETRFVNAAGDNMTGQLTISGNKVWHAGNDGASSGLDADLLDGQDSSFYRNASNLNAGTVPSARLSGTYGISITGNAATATNATHANNADYATSAGNADTVDGKHASAFATASHGHGEYVLKAGDTMTGSLAFNNNVGPAGSVAYNNVASYSSGSSSITGTMKISLPVSWTSTMLRMTIVGYDYSGVGAWEAVVSGYNYSSGWTNYSAEIRGNAPFNVIRLGHDGTKCVVLLGNTSTVWKYPKVVIKDVVAGHSNYTLFGSGWAISIISSESGISSIVSPAVRINWNSGNDGSGSGMDADLLDGQDSAFYRDASNLNAGTVPTGRLSGTYGISITGNAATATNATNADKLDNIDSSQFLRSDAADTATGPIYFRGGLSAEAQTKDDITTRTPSGFWQTNSATTGEGWPQTTNTWYHLLSSTHSNTGIYYSMQFAGSFYNSNDIYYRSTSNSGTTPWNKLWHSGNDGSGSGLDADLLDGYHGSDYRDAAKLTGILPAARLSGTYNIDISGNAATATKLATARSITLTGNASGSATFDGSGNISISTTVSYASNADTVDSKHAADFVLKAGDTMTGDLAISKNKAWLTLDSPSSGANDNEQAAGISIGEAGKFGGAALHLTYTGDGYSHIGMGAVGTANPQYEAMTLYYLDNVVRFNNTPTVSGNKVWHAGNDGSGSGMDADMVDGKHASELGGGSFNGIRVYSSFGTYTWTKNPGTKYVFVQLVGAGGGGSVGDFLPGGTGGTSYFGSYFYATGGTGVYGSGAVGYGYGGDINVPGKRPSGESGGESIYFGFGAGGKGVGTNHGGCSGGYAHKWVDVSEVSSVSVTVGKGGNPGNLYASPGGNGVVIIHEFK